METITGIKCENGLQETKIFVTEISVEDMLVREEKAYNPSIWKDRVLGYEKYEKLQFYVCEKGNGCDYTRFFVSYIINGIYFFSEFSAFSASLTNAPFCMVHILQGQIYRKLFKFPDGEFGYAANNKESREFFKKSLTPMGIMVSTRV